MIRFSREAFFHATGLDAEDWGIEETGPAVYVTKDGQAQTSEHDVCRILTEDAPSEVIEIVKAAWRSAAEAQSSQRNGR